MVNYDYVIVGAGLFGATFAHQAKQAGKRCLVIDKRPHSGGNIYCQNVDGINVHYYGAHIFHTNDRPIWDFVNSFVEFNRYTNSPVANHEGKLYNLPFNMNTFYQLWGVITPDEAQAKIQEQIGSLGITHPKNLEEQALMLVGTDIYEKLIKGYTEKQWGRKATELPAFIIKRLPVRFTFDNNYFNDKYQGIPIGGYNKLAEGLLEGIEVRLDTNFFDDPEYFRSLGENLVYTGQLDEYYNYRFGPLEYRSLRFEHKHLERANYQGNAVVNYTEAHIPYTRIIEHKHFEFGTQPHTVITYEYPATWEKGMEPYYPLNDEANTKRFKQYAELAEGESNVIFGGRLAEYRYYDMHQVIGSALAKARKVLHPDSNLKISA
ncbi:UDP-galactopyranose mutase [Flaviaesturariibacter aridisoli]|uniref:UDP-galactopyranose mutase n=1 Tax=Flaviaesturariibacter aridisoli TaxID=2545761 RepID=A0A4R4DZJ1_9BACT|nr:UDP-galactopyranose mutase [Flaviaesturariibacter aridisoli]TCZ67880.1 UDP-galactopyranose mutase [Flaviaesturariibacter aridisoli]